MVFSALFDEKVSVVGSHGVSLRFSIKMSASSSQDLRYSSLWTPGSILQAVFK